jgi:hypothetical protein
MTPEEKEREEERGASYEAPAIEEVVTPDSIEREAHYAGVVPPSQAPN